MLHQQCPWLEWPSTLLSLRWKAPGTCNERSVIDAVFEPRAKRFARRIEKHGAGGYSNETTTVSSIQLCTRSTADSRLARKVRDVK